MYLTFSSQKLFLNTKIFVLKLFFFFEKNDIYVKYYWTLLINKGVSYIYLMFKQNIGAQ